MAVDWSAFEDLDPGRPGVVAAVVRGGAVAEWGSFGRAVGGDDGPLSLSTPFYVASLAKQFTAAALGLLVFDGALSLSDPVRKWLPETGSSWEAMQVGHLVAHTSGLPDCLPIDAAHGFSFGWSGTTAERAAVITALDVVDAPGTLHRYSNHGYVLLAVVVERAGGVGLGDMARSRFFDPLEMRHSRFFDSPGPPAVPGWAGGTKEIIVRFTCLGDGGLISTVGDLARWDGWLPSSPLAEVMLRERPLVADGLLAHDAWGISIRTHHGQRIESHGGTFDGYGASFVRFPALGVTFIALANTDNLGARDLGPRLRQVIDTELADQLDWSLPPLTETHGQPLGG